MADNGQIMEFQDEPANGELQDVPERPGAIRIILADSQAIYRVGIRKIFALEDDLRVVAQADSLENLRDAVLRYPTDIVLLEGGLLSGTSNVIPELVQLVPNVKLIVQAIATDESQTVELYRKAKRRISGWAIPAHERYIWPVSSHLGGCSQSSRRSFLE